MDGQLDFFDVIGVEEKWREEWKGMPEFEHDDETPYQKIIVNFKTKEDVRAFAKLIEQRITPRTNSIWYPPYVTPKGIYVES